VNTKTSLVLFKGKLNQVTHLKENFLDQGQAQCLGTNDGFIDIVFLVNHLGIRLLIIGQGFGTELGDGISSNK